MTNLLIKLFVKDSKNPSDPAVRKRYGYLGAFTGIVLNILLFLGKLIAGILSGGISVIADAFNNLSDAGSSIMTFVGFKMAGMPADSGIGCVFAVLYEQFYKQISHDYPPILHEYGAT